jgi:hypothetical protein
LFRSTKRSGKLAAKSQFRDMPESTGERPERAAASFISLTGTGLTCVLSS